MAYNLNVWNILSHLKLQLNIILSIQEEYRYAYLKI